MATLNKGDNDIIIIIIIIIICYLILFSSLVYSNLNSCKNYSILIKPSNTTKYFVVFDGFISIL